MAFEQWLALSAVCLLGAASPGPSLAVVLQSTLLGSRRSGIATAWGHGCGVALYAGLTVAGLGLLVTGLPALFTAIRLAGAAYLIWIALQAWGAVGGGEDTETSASQRSGFLRGALVALLNPKLMLFMLALFSQFIRPGAGWSHGATLILTAGLIDALWYSAVAFMAGSNAVRLGLSRHAVALNRGFALLLVTLAAWVILDSLH